MLRRRRQIRPGESAVYTIVLVGLVVAFLLAPSALTAPLGPEPSEDGQSAGAGDRPGAGGQSPAPQPAPAPAGSFGDSTVLVGFEAGTTADEQRAIVAGAGAAEERVIGAGTHVLRVPKGQVAAKIALLKKHSKVRYAEPDYTVQADMTPNDRYYRQLWGLPKIQAEQAWDVTTGSQSVVVGVVDTGIDYNHPDLAANVWSNNGTINGCAAGTHGYNARTLTCDPLDDHNHGTHVAGTIGAVGNNGIGVAGVNSSVKLMGLKFLSSSGSGSTSGAIAAIDWAVKAKLAGVNVRVLSNSWGGGGYSQALRDEITKAGANDILFVAAAGNNGGNNDAAPNYPASYALSNVLSVAAVDSDDALAPFSNYGRTSVDLAAPGVSIESTVPGGYATASGTSMATPHVAAVAALIVAKYGTGVSPNFVYAKLKATADDLGAPGIDPLYGYGRVNAYRAVTE